jgi:hypothetical protein
MPMLLYGNGMISGATTMPSNIQFGGSVGVTGTANITGNMTASGSILNGSGNALIRQSGSLLNTSYQYTTSGTNFNATNASYQNTAVSFNYTPVSSSSTLIVIFKCNVFLTPSVSGGWLYPQFRIYESTTTTILNSQNEHGMRLDLGTFTKENSQTLTTMGTFTNTNTNQKTFLLQALMNDINGGFNCGINNRSNSQGSMTLFEVAA